MNKTIFRTLIAAAAIALFVPVSTKAQFRGRVGVGRWYQPRGFVGGYGYGWGGWSQGSSTVAEGQARGMAEVIRAQGEASEAEARARLTREEARSKHLENKKKSAETYYAMKERHRQYQQEKRQLKRERAAAGRAKLEATTTPRQRGLGPDDFDPVTGTINWPDTLLGDEYTQYRTQLDELFEHHALTSGAVDDATLEQIQSIAKEMRAELKKSIRELSSTDYIAARKFLDALAYEGRG